MPNPQIAPRAAQETARPCVRLDCGQGSCPARAYACAFEPTHGASMVLQELLTSEAGLMSLGVIGFMLGMAVFMYFRFRAYVRADSAKK